MGQTIQIPSVPTGPGTELATITALGTGTGGVGSYTLDKPLRYPAGTVDIHMQLEFTAATAPATLDIALPGGLKAVPGQAVTVFDISNAVPHGGYTAQDGSQLRISLGRNPGRLQALSFRGELQ